jgi:large subunit ribosomal protein L21
MYAVIETGGKQYRVELGAEIEVDRLDVEPGQTIELERVLLIADGDQAMVGRPVVDGARVSARVLRQDRGDKIVVFKYKPKARSRVKKGARAELTVLRIADIAWAGRSAAQEGADPAEKRRAEAEAAARVAESQAAADQALAAKLAAAAPPEPTAPAKSTRRGKAPTTVAAADDMPADDTPAAVTDADAGSQAAAVSADAATDVAETTDGADASVDDQKDE